MRTPRWLFRSSSSLGPSSTQTRRSASSSIRQRYQGQRLFRTEVLAGADGSFTLPFSTSLAVGQYAVQGDSKGRTGRAAVPDFPSSEGGRHQVTYDGIPGALQSPTIANGSVYIAQKCKRWIHLPVESGEPAGQRHCCNGSGQSLRQVGSRRCPLASRWSRSTSTMPVTNC